MPLQEVLQRIGAQTFRGYLVPLTLAQLSTNSDALIAGTEVDGAPFDFVALSTIIATNGVTLTLQGANLPDFSDAVQLHSQALAIGTHGILPNINGYFQTRYLRCLVRSTTPGAHGSIQVAIMVKRDSCTL